MKSVCACTTLFSPMKEKKGENGSVVLYCIVLCCGVKFPVSVSAFSGLP